MTGELIRQIALECGFEIAGIASADPPEDFARYDAWVQAGHAGDMRYLTDRRADVRRDVRNLLPTARSVICVGKLYNQESTPARTNQAGISRYAWGADYHEVVRAGLERMVARLREIAEFDHKICVDTAPILERTFARLAGIGWIGKNTCLINEPLGSWFFLGEIVTSLELAAAAPPPDRCGTCSRCIDACPTDAFVQGGDAWAIDSRKCIAYWTVEARGSIPEDYRASMGTHVFGCDLCQDVCPWNSHAPVSDAFQSTHSTPPLEDCARLTEPEYRTMFRDSAVTRAKYPMFLRNVAIAMGNSRQERFLEPLRELAHHTDVMVAEHAQWALSQW